MCGPAIRCGTCGNNTCNGGYGEVDGKHCPDCPEAYAVCQAWYDSRLNPEVEVTPEELESLGLVADDKISNPILEAAEPFDPWESPAYIGGGE